MKTHHKVLIRTIVLAGVVAGSGGLAGCVNVRAPDKPIVVELNINVKQEVVYRLAGDAGSAIDRNKEIF